VVVGDGGIGRRGEYGEQDEEEDAAGHGGATWLAAGREPWPGSVYLLGQCVNWLLASWWGNGEDGRVGEEGRCGGGLICAHG
jgi:hypothetical protein